MKRIINYNYYINYDDYTFIENELNSCDFSKDKLEIIDNFINNIIYEITINEDNIFEYISLDSLRKRLYSYLILHMALNKFRNTRVRK